MKSHVPRPEAKKSKADPVVLHGLAGLALGFTLYAYVIHHIINDPVMLANISVKNELMQRTLLIPLFTCIGGCVLGLKRPVANLKSDAGLSAIVIALVLSTGSSFWIWFNDAVSRIRF